MNNFSWAITDLVMVTEGKLLTNFKQELFFSSITTDTRNLKKGALYIAIKGEFFDGHEFVEQAFTKGAIAVLVAKKQQIEQPQILVEDTIIAFGKFAQWHRQQMNLQQLIAITGSNGKTTCKNIIYHLLSGVLNSAEVLATVGNLNNNFGVPSTLLSINKQHKYAVVEMGANHSKEIDYISKLAQPDIALITIAGRAHLEGFGSIEGVIKAKSEIMNGMVRGGSIVLNADSAGFDYWQKVAIGKKLKVLSFGKSALATFKLLDFKQNLTSSEFSFSYDLKTYNASFAMLGEHNCLNILASIAACVAANFKVAKLLPHLLSFSGVNGRLDQFKLPNGLLLDDSYNANPDSVKVAINTLVTISTKTIFCMGPMVEIGKDSAQQHKAIAKYAKQAGVNFLLCSGTATKNMPASFGKGSYWFASQQELGKRAINLIKTRQADSCLVKGSRAAKMEEVVTIIKGYKGVLC